ncbi:NAD(P)-binding protein [Acephala macrosclerotiorum]|nr:NAD(P)-binding protein [Acephala macrosclerotiorum]
MKSAAELLEHPHLDAPPRRPTSIFPQSPYHTSFDIARRQAPPTSFSTKDYPADNTKLTSRRKQTTFLRQGIVPEVRVCKSETIWKYQISGTVVMSIVITGPETPLSLSKTYKIRAVTRDTTKPAAQALSSQGVELVQGDADDASTLGPILKNAHTVFSLTTTTYDSQCYTRELTQGKAIADACVAANVQYLIFSSLPHCPSISSGKYKGVESFDAKADVETYIRGLPIKSAFFMPGSFMQNFHTRVMQPVPMGDGVWGIFNVVSPETLLPLIDTGDDTGKYIGAVLAEPEKFEGKSLCASTEVRTMDDICETISRMSGKTMVYKQLPESVFRGFMPNEVQAENIVQMMLYIQDFGYYGKDFVEKVAETGEMVGAKLTTLEEYLEKHPLVLQ